MLFHPTFPLQAQPPNVYPTTRRNNNAGNLSKITQWKRKENKKKTIDAALPLEQITHGEK